MYLAKVDLDLGFPGGLGQGKEKGPREGTWQIAGTPELP